MLQSMNQLGSILRGARGRLGLTQIEVAAKAGLSPTTLAALEGGLVTRARALTLASLAKVLGVSFEDLQLASMPRPQGADVSQPPENGTGKP